MPFKLNLPMPGYVYRVNRLVITAKTGAWCRLPYQAHPKGCPNYGKEKSYCPPHAPKLHEYFDCGRELYLVHSEFDLGQWKAKMKSLHPEWSDRQCGCVLYWQGSSRAELRARVRVFMAQTGFNRYTTCPEAMGLNVYATAALAGLHLEKIDGLKICRHVALVGHIKRT